MGNQPVMLKSSAMPAQEVKPLPGGSIYTAAIADGNNQTQSQMNLIGQGKYGGSKRIRRFNGGAAVIQVPPIPTSATDPVATGGNYKDITILAQQQSSSSVYDNATNPSQTAAIQQQQQSLYKGGSRKGKRGGSWPRWGCFSGGKKSKKRGRKSCKCKKRNNKGTKRHRH